MLSTRWIKLLRDLKATPARIAIMLVAIAAGVFAFTFMLSTYTILSQEVSRNYLATHPASARLEIENIDADLLKGIRRFPGIAHAQASASLNATHFLPDGNPHPLKIFVIEDFKQLNLNQFFTEAGAWPPLPNSLLLERYSLTQAQIKMGDLITVRLNDGSMHRLNVSGSVHDPAMPVPSMTAFAYMSPNTLEALGASVPLTELNISLSDQPLNADAIEQVASQLALWIEQQGHKVSRIYIPPPGEHPHQRIFFGVSGVFLLFGAIALLLSALLTATLMDGLMAKQIRQVGVMKTIGASALQIAGLYLVFVLILSVLATALGLLPGLAAGRALAKIFLANLNFTLLSAELPYSIYLTIIAADTLLPLLTTMVPIVRSTRTSVQGALSNYGVPFTNYRSALSLMGIDPSLQMAIRNSFRQRGRLLLILTLLTSAGAIFISSLNLKYAAQQHLIAAAAERHYDLEVILDKPTDRQTINTIVTSVQGVAQVEAWAMTRIGRHRTDGLTIERTYADGSHGAVYVTAIPQNSKLLSLSLQQGHWLKSTAINGEDEAVLNRKALEIFPHAELDSQITLGINGNVLPLRIAGIANQKMTGGMAYVSAATFQKITGQDERYKNYRVVLNQHDEQYIDEIAKTIEATLTQERIKVSAILTETKLRHETDSHFTLLLNALLLVSILIAVVGAVGLASVMSTQIAERAREFGIMRSIGASSGIILRNVIAEGIIISLTSWMFAVALSFVVSLVVNNFIGKLIFDEAFPLAMSFNAFWNWLVIVVACAILASSYPAKKAASITIHESFSI